MAVAADFGLRVLLLGALLEAPDQLHGAVDPQQKVAVLLLQLKLLRRNRLGGRSGGLAFTVAPFVSPHDGAERGRRGAKGGGFPPTRPPLSLPARPPPVRGAPAA